MNQDLSSGRLWVTALSTLPCFPTGGLLTCVRPPKKKISKVWSLQYKLVTISTISTSKFCMLIFRLSRCRLVFIIHHFVRINWLIIIIFLVNTKKYQHCTVPIHFSAESWQRHAATSMLVTDFGDKMCWWQLWIAGDRYITFTVSPQHHEKSHQYYDSVINI